MTHFSPQMVADGGHPDVDFLAVDLRAQLAVLGAASLDDVHAGHDLDPADQADTHGRGERQDLLESAVDPVADPDAQFGRLDVHVRGPVTHGLRQDAAHDLDDRSIVGHDVRRQGRGLHAPSPGALHGLERLDEMVETADGSVVVLNGSADLDQMARASGGWRCHSSRSRRVTSSGDGWSAMATWRPDVVERHGDDEVLPSHGVGDEVQGRAVRDWSVEGRRRPSRRARPERK